MHMSAALSDILITGRSQAHLRRVLLLQQEVREVQAAMAAMAVTAHLRSPAATVPPVLREAPEVRHMPAVLSAFTTSVL
jgi:hypothetical protein